MGSYTVLFRFKRLWQQALNLIYPDTRTTCALCQRPMGSLQEHTSSLPRQRDVPSGFQRAEQRRRNEPQEQRIENERAYTLEGVCLFCLQDATLFSYRRWHGRLRIHNGSEKHRVMPVLCAVTYEGIIRDTIRHWKYDGHVEFTGYLAHLIATAMRESESYAASQWDVLTCVPTSPDRLRKRGYHHVGMLLEEVAKQLELPFQELLIRRKNNGHNSNSSAADMGFTQSQTAKSARERRQSLKGQFALRDQEALSSSKEDQRGTQEGLQGMASAQLEAVGACAGPSRLDNSADELANRSILLLDDVVTTGATLEACAKVLIEAGAKQVMGIAIAHVE